MALDEVSQSHSSSEEREGPAGDRVVRGASATGTQPADPFGNFSFTNYATLTQVCGGHEL